MEITRVLIVDDSPTVRLFLKSMLLEDSGMEVVGEACNGREAVEMTTLLQPDLITMDIMMPEMDGLEATRRIMAVRPTPIVIVSAHANSVDLTPVFEAMKAGALEVIAKPHGNSEMANADPAWRENLLAKLKALAGASPRTVG
jgi:two-component system, chemotaxis family, protein-glutamate methylesterase/glutaminase